jgi:hypothetical protein
MERSRNVMRLSRHDLRLGGDRLMTLHSGELEVFKHFSDVCRVELRKYSPH